MEDVKPRLGSVVAPLVFLGILSVPAIVIGFTPLASATAQVFVGVGVGVVGSLFGGRVGLGMVIGSTVLTGLADLAGPWPWVAPF